MDKKRSKAATAAAIIFWVLTTACCAAIFWFSAQHADDSAELSFNVQGWLGRFLGMLPGINIVRKCAHFLEYCGLSFLLSFALYFTFGRQRQVLTVLLSFIYCVTDEIHQIFVPGRACRVFDMFIDTLGALLSVVLITLFFLIISAIKKRRRKHDEIK